MGRPVTDSATHFKRRMYVTFIGKNCYSKTVVEVRPHGNPALNIISLK